MAAPVSSIECVCVFWAVYVCVCDVVYGYRYGEERRLPVNLSLALLVESSRISHSHVFLSSYEMMMIRRINYA